MIEEQRGRIDYDEHGAGPTILLVPGSCSTGAAWRPVIAGWNDEFRCVTTSLLGYGATAERRTASDVSIAHEILEAVIRRAGGRVHLVGHSFGGLAALAVALRNHVPLASLVIAEAPAISVLRDPEERQHRYAFAQMTREYFTALADGDREAIATMIDFYGGAGTFASWPPRVRNYAVETTPVNILDWASADGFDLSAASLAALEIPTLVVVGGSSHPAIRRANELLSQRINGAIFATIEGSAHFMISTHAEQVARLIAAHVRRAEKARDARTIAVRPLQAAYGMHSSS